MPIRQQPSTGQDLAEQEREFADACRLHELRLGRPLDARDVLFVARELGCRKVSPCPTNPTANPTRNPNHYLG